MKQELQGLSHCVVAGGDSLAREGAGLLGALLSGHTAMVQVRSTKSGWLAGWLPYRCKGCADAFKPAYLC